MIKVKISQLAMILLGVLLAGIAALYGLGHSYRGFFTPKSAGGSFQFIHADGWIEQGARIFLPELAPRGNRLDLNFNSWRPAGVGPASLRVSVCGKLVSEFQVTPQNSSQRVYLSGECEPREVAFEVLNPFVASESDQRALGAQLISAQVSSKLGVPLVTYSTIIGTILAIFILAFMLSRVFVQRTNSSFILLAPHLLVPPIAYLLLAGADNIRITKVFALWVLATSITAGMLLASRLSRRELNPEPRLERSTRGLIAFGMFVTVLCGAALRFYGLSFGLPNNYHPDEVPKINAIMRMVASGTLNPEYFLHPSLLLYLTYFMNKFFHLVGIQELLQIPPTFRDTAYLAGRTVSALAGTLSIYLIYLIGCRLFSPFTGLLGAALLAVFPLHVTCSRYLKEDALLTCVLLACLLAMLKAAQEDRKGYLYLSGLLAGVAASSKYSGLLAGIFVLAAPWVRSKSLSPDYRYFRHCFFALCAMPLGFVLCTPYSILTPDKFLTDFGSERRHMLRGHTIPVDAWSQYWMYHFWRSIIPGMSMFTTVVSVLGLGLLLWRRRIEDLYLVALVLVFYLPAEWVKAKPEPQPERYIYPCIPFLALAAGEVVRVLRASHFRLAVPVLALFLIAFPARRSLQLASEIRYDTRTQLADWMVQNLPQGSKVYLDWKPYAPRFWHNEFQVTYIPRAKILEKLDVDNLKSSGYDYLVLSGLFYERYFTQPLADPGLRQKLREVFEQVPIVKEVGPQYGTYGFNNPTLTLFSLQHDDFMKLALELNQKKHGQLSQTSNELRASFRWR